MRRMRPYSHRSRSPKSAINILKDTTMAYDLCKQIAETKNEIAVPYSV